MSRLKILQLIYDGFTPEIGEFVTCDPKDYHRYQFRSLLPFDIPASSKMWAKIYSNTYPDPLEARHNPTLDGEHFFKKSGWNVIPKENWIWNKLASKNVKVYGILYYLLRYADDSINIYPEHSRLFSMMTHTRQAKMLGFNKFIDIEPYSVFCEGYDSIHTRVPEIHKFFEMVWRDPRLHKLLEMIAHMVEHVVFPEIRVSMKNNIKTYKILSEYYNNEDFVTLPMVESDSLYHFAYPYDIYKEYINYFYEVGDIFFQKMDPDIIINIGDHEMTSVLDKETCRSSIRAKFNYKGEEYEAIKAGWSISPFYMEHTDSASMIMYTKDKYIGREIYDYISKDLFHGKTLHEALYRFLTREYPNMKVSYK